MDNLTLILGSRNYSSWSLRAWLAAELSGLRYETILIHFDEDPTGERRLVHSPSGAVPVLRHGELVVWDSLAIGEYLAELAPNAKLWPKDRAARAQARSIAAKMHSGFPDLRRELPMNVRLRRPWSERSPDVMADIERIISIWTDTRTRFGAGGPFLFGAPTLADAYYAPVATRFTTYSVPLQDTAVEYVRTVLDWAPMRAWIDAARVEGHPVAAYDALP